MATISFQGKNIWIALVLASAVSTALVTSTSVRR